MWRRRKTEKGKGGKHFEKENIFWEEKEKEEIIWRRKINGDANQPTNQPGEYSAICLFER